MKRSRIIWQTPFLLTVFAFFAGCASSGYVFGLTPGTNSGQCLPLAQAGQEQSVENIQNALEGKSFSCQKRDKSGAGTLLVCNKRLPDGALTFQVHASGKNRQECEAAVRRMQQLQKAVTRNQAI